MGGKEHGLKKKKTHSQRRLQNPGVTRVCVLGAKKDC